MEMEDGGSGERTRTGRFETDSTNAQVTNLRHDQAGCPVLWRKGYATFFDNFVKRLFRPARGGACARRATSGESEFARIPLHEMPRLSENARSFAGGNETFVADAASVGVDASCVGHELQTSPFRPCRHYARLPITGASQKVQPRPPKLNFCNRRTGRVDFSPSKENGTRGLKSPLRRQRAGSAFWRKLCIKICRGEC